MAYTLDYSGKIVFGKYKGENALELIKTDKGLEYILYMEKTTDRFFGKNVSTQISLILKTKRFSEYKKVFSEQMIKEDKNFNFSSFLEGNESTVISIFESMDKINFSIQLDSRYTDEEINVNLKEL